jgi:membrane protein
VWGRWPLLTLMVVLGFAVLYRFAPHRSHPRWRWITWGSAIATALWIVGSVLFSFYVSHFGSYDATYGSLGAVIILLLWFWVSALVMILGAEIDSELDTRATNGGAPLAGTAPSAGPPSK